MSVVILRPLALADAEAMASVLADPSLYEFTGGEPPTVAELERRYAIQVRGHSADGREAWVNEIIEVEEKPVGFVQATIAEGGASAEIGWVVGRPWQGQGYARQATQLLVEELAARGVRELVAHIHPGHVASQRIALRLAMVATNVVVDGETRWTGEVPTVDRANGARTR